MLLLPQTNYTIDFVQSHMPAAMELAIDSVINPRLQYWEVRDTYEDLMKELPDSLAKNPMLSLNEV